MAKPSGSKGNREQGKPPKKPKKKSGSRILDQMEFYFSDSNLRRDKFLREKISECVPKEIVPEEGASTEPDKPTSHRLGLELSLFLNFNNIKAMTTDVCVLQAALAKSQLLSCFQVATDDTAQWFVGRVDWIERTELTEFLSELDGNNQEFDKRTIYCENLPINASQQWLRQIFAQFGKINLVSVPKFKGHQRIKQFCFVEFAEEAPLKAVLEYFQQFNGVLCYDETDSDNLQSIQKFHEEHGQKGAEAEKGDTKGGQKKGKRSGKRGSKKELDTQGAGASVGAPVEEEQEDEAGEEEEDQEDTKVNKYPELNDNMIHDLKIMTK